MRIGMQLDPRGRADIESILRDFEAAEREGFDTVWLGQLFSHDVLTLLALAGLRTERIELGSFVVPLPTRHVATLAQQALTAQLATKGRLCLGVGSGHAAILGKKLGLPSDRPVARTREALEVLLPLLRGEYLKYAGEFEGVRVGTPVAGAKAPGVILAALGPRMIELAAELTDGVALVYMSPDHVASQVRPRLPEGARIVASLPVVVTKQPGRAREIIDELTGPSAALAVYQRTMAAQSAARVSDLSLVGRESEVEDGLAALESSGVTDLNPILIRNDADPHCARRTRELLADRSHTRRA